MNEKQSLSQVEKILDEAIQNKREQIEACHSQRCVLLCLFPEIEQEISRGATLQTIYKALSKKELIKYKSYQSFFVTINRMGIAVNQIKKDAVSPYIKEKISAPGKKSNEEEAIPKTEETIAENKDFSINKFTSDSEKYIQKAAKESEQEIRDKRKAKRKVHDTE